MYIYTEKQDEVLQEIKRDIQKQSTELVNSGILKQSDLFLINIDRAKRAIVVLKG